jgi:hypothetical protein
VLRASIGVDAVKTVTEGVFATSPGLQVAGMQFGSADVDHTGPIVLHGDVGCSSNTNNG